MEKNKFNVEKLAEKINSDILRQCEKTTKQMFGKRKKLTRKKRSLLTIRERNKLNKLNQILVQNGMVSGIKIISYKNGIVNYVYTPIVMPREINFGSSIDINSLGKL